jgi:hypothetical protein
MPPRSPGGGDEVVARPRLFVTGETLVRRESDGSVRQVADGFLFPNGTPLARAVTPTGHARLAIWGYLAMNSLQKDGYL